MTPVPVQTVQAFRIVEAVNLFQSGLVAIVAVIAMLFCLSKRDLSPWIYAIAIGLAGSVAAVVPSLLMQFRLIFDPGADPQFQFGWLFTLASFGGTIARIALYGGLIGLVVDISRKFDLWREIQAAQGDTSDR